MGPRTRSCSQQNTVGKAPPSDEQEERNVQASLAQTAIDEAARTVARDTLQRRAQLHNLRIVEKGGDGHCLQYSVQDQLRQQGIDRDGQTMQVLRPALASFIQDKAEYFQGILTDEESEPDAWRGLLDDIRHSDGDARRRGGDLEISALSCMFQCHIQYITSRQGDAYEGLIITQHNASLYGWWRRFKKKYDLPDDLYLIPLTLFYEEGRHWQSSEALIPQLSTSVAGRPQLPARVCGGSTRR